ncbi:PIN domain-containing protein [Endozoicomonas sp. 4G]|uniref:type II toxin-antitoxin system VapC family toxin n=1 Tax=Endozoicomonas sp. 4G TaxID=2872754 RepID=UPI0020789B6F|nr:PIN domain-containing protein [Endozoicomonas sp. 4G]
MDTMIDTSVWIDFFNGANNAHVLSLEHLLQTGNACICPVVLMEVLQGIRTDKQYRQTERLMSSLTCFTIPEAYYKDSAKLYRDLRKQGVTIRKSIDCLIAVTAINNGLPILHRDRDFSAIEKHSGLVCTVVKEH